MTNEEAIKYLKQIYPNGGHCWLDSQRIEAIEMAIMALSKPSLPSNLDEAAEKIAWDIAPKYPDISWDNCFEKIKDGFKSGAEWMARQGQTFEAHVDNGCAIASGVKLPFVLWDTFEDVDALKVQIRKK